MSAPGDSQQLSLMRLGDSAQAWQAAGFTVHTPPATTDDRHPFVVLSRTRIELVGDGGGFLGWGFGSAEATPVGDIDGLPVIPDPAAADSRAENQPPHPNGVSSIDHVVIDSDDLGRTTAALEDHGFTRSGGRTTESYGSPMAQSFFWAGDVILELVGPPPEADREADEAEGAGSASLFGLALVADDLDRTAEAMGDLLGSPKEAVQPGRWIAGVRGRDLGLSLPIAVMSPHVKT